MDDSKLDQLLAENNVFFERLVGLVLARHYFVPDDQPVNVKYLKKSVQETTKRAFKEQYKEKKKARLASEAPVTALDVQREQVKQSQMPAMPQANFTPGRAVTRKELEERLRSKIQNARQQRKAPERDPALQAKEWRQQQLARKQKQRQRPSREAGTEKSVPPTDADNSKRQEQLGRVAHPQAANKQGPDADVAQFKFGLIDVGDGGKQQRAKKAKRKALPLTEALKVAEAQRQAKLAAEASAVKAAGGGTGGLSDWRSAVARARGDKVLDDPKMLRRSLKRRQREQQRSAAAWEQRTQQQQERQQAQQAKRHDNLAARTATKLENKKAKREKKLLRPGFEGRKQGFIAKK